MVKDEASNFVKKSFTYLKFTQIAKNFMDVVFALKNLPEEVNVFIMMHSDERHDTASEVVETKIKTSGKLIDNLIDLQSIFTYVLQSKKLVIEDEDTGKKSIRYVFQTNDMDGTTPTKSPLGCFDQIYVDNDLAVISEIIHNYEN